MDTVVSDRRSARPAADVARFLAGLGARVGRDRVLLARRTLDCDPDCGACRYLVALSGGRRGAALSLGCPVGGVVRHQARARVSRPPRPTTEAAQSYSF